MKHDEKACPKRNILKRIKPWKNKQDKIIKSKKELNVRRSESIEKKEWKLENATKKRYKKRKVFRC